MLLAHDLFDRACLQDPYALYDRMRAADPVQRIGDSTFYAATSFEAVVEATGRPQDFSSNLTATMWHQPDGTVAEFTMEGPGGATHVLATADDPIHAVHRKLVLPRLAARRMLELEPFIAATAADLIPTGDFDWMAGVADRLPMLVVARLLGLPAADVDQLVTWAYASTQLLDGVVDQEHLMAAGVAAVELGGYLVEQFGRASANPGDDLLGDFATYCATERLGTETAVFMLIQLVSAGAESTAALIGSAVQVLAQRPDVADRLRGDVGLIPVFLEEVLRYESPFRGHFRHVLADTTLAWTTMPAGSHLLLLWGAANRDPATFENPHEFRMDRANAKGHLAFGRGAHFCVGAALARLEARVVLTHLLGAAGVIEPAGDAEWLPSLLVRRLSRLPLAVR